MIIQAGHSWFKPTLYVLFQKYKGHEVKNVQFMPGQVKLDFLLLDILLLTATVNECSLCSPTKPLVVCYYRVIGRERSRIEKTEGMRKAATEAKRTGKERIVRLNGPGTREMKSKNRETGGSLEKRGCFRWPTKSPRTPENLSYQGGRGRFWGSLSVILLFSGRNHMQAKRII